MCNLKSKIKNNQTNLYILIGDELLLSEKIIQKILFKINLTEKVIYYKFHVNTNINWTEIFNKFCNFDLFNPKVHIILIFPENITNDMHQNLFILISLSNQSNILTICIKKMTNVIKNQIWFKNIKEYSTIIDFNIDTQKKFSFWIKSYSQMLRISIDTCVENFLFKTFKKNIHSVLKLLDKLSIMFPNQVLTLTKIKKIIHSDIIYTIDQLITAIFLRNMKLAKFSLNKIKLQKIFDPLIILRYIQNNVIYIIKIKDDNNLISNKNKVWKKNYKILLEFSKNISLKELHATINLILILEVMLKTSCKNTLVWHFFNEIILILCGYNLITSKIYEKKINFNCFLRRYF
ncbi:MAG: DNA polymerase III subunit delta [Wigglesworthia glossinidia]|nr:DNA polymerase III subunit delta [Wigglesworthia glossinidia]